MQLLHPRLALLALRAVAGCATDADGGTTQRYALDEPPPPPPPREPPSEPAADDTQASPAQEVAIASSAPASEDCAAPCQPNAAAKPTASAVTAAAEETASPTSTPTTTATTTAAGIPGPSAARPPTAQAPSQELLSHERQEFGSRPARVNGASIEQAASSRPATTVITAASLQGPSSLQTAARGQDFEGVGAAARNELTYVQRRYKTGLRVMTVGSGEIKGLNLCLSVTPAVRSLVLLPPCIHLGKPGTLVVQLRTVWASPLQDPEWRSAAFGPTAELQVRLLASYPATPVAVEVVAPSLLPRVLAAVEGGFATEAAALAATQRPDALRCLLRFVDNHIGRLAAEAVSVCARGVSCGMKREASPHPNIAPWEADVRAADWTFTG